jgi:GT2 family glycosyltransferase
MNEAPLISVIVVNWNGLAFLSDCLTSLENQTWDNLEFIIVDNGSTDGSTEIIRSWSERRPNAIPVLLSKNTGFCEGNNHGIAMAHGEWIALLNNDAIAEPDWIEQLARFRRVTEKIGMVGSKILFAEPPNVIDKAGHLIYWDGQNRGRGTMEADVGQYDLDEEILWPDACAALYHRRVFEETGGFDESFFAYGDDADLGMRARLLGWKAWYAPSAVVHHRHSATAGVYSPLKVMLVERNRLLLAVKNFTLPLLLANPYWTIRRILWHVYAASRGQGASGQLVASQGWLRTLGIMAWAHLSALNNLPIALRNRWKIQRTKRLSNREVKDLLHRFQIDLHQLTHRN